MHKVGRNRVISFPGDLYPYIQTFILDVKPLVLEDYYYYPTFQVKVHNQALIEHFYLFKTQLTLLLVEISPDLVKIPLYTAENVEVWSNGSNLSDRLESNFHAKTYDST